MKTLEKVPLTNFLDLAPARETINYRDWLLAPQEVSIQIETRISDLLRQMKEYGEHTSATP